MQIIFSLWDDWIFSLMFFEYFRINHCIHSTPNAREFNSNVYFKRNFNVPKFPMCMSCKNIKNSIPNRTWLFPSHAMICHKLLSYIIRVNFYFFQMISTYWIFSSESSFLTFYMYIQLHVYCVSFIALNILKDILKYTA